LLGRILGVSGKKIFRWYQGSSGYLTERTKLNKQILNKDGKPKKRLSKDIVVQNLKKIWKTSNFGSHMAIDEKHIGGVFYTIITNIKTSKVTAILKTIKAKEIKECLYTLPKQTRWNVKVLTRDLSSTFENIGKEVFFNANHIADKFHVIKMGFEALQAIRIRYRQEALMEERLRVETHKEKERELKNLAEKNGKSYIMKKISLTPLLQNNETKLQLLARSRYLLFKFENQWNDNQKARSKILFQIYPEIKQAYDLIIKFRIFYNLKYGKNSNYKKAKNELKLWKEAVGAVNISEIQNFSSSVENHKTEILNYFRDGNTNAIAESINAKIQRFVISNYGTRDPNFFFFRLRKFLT